MLRKAMTFSTFFLIVKCIFYFNLAHSNVLPAANNNATIDTHNVAVFTIPNYYGENFLPLLNAEKQPSQASNSQIKEDLNKILTATHVLLNEHSPHKIVSFCPVNQQCIQHNSHITYTQARSFLLSKIELIPLHQNSKILPEGMVIPPAATGGQNHNDELNDLNGNENKRWDNLAELNDDHSQHSNWALWDPYCQKLWSSEEMPDDVGAPSPEHTPDHNLINVEHVWPQHYFNRNFDPRMQKTDLHHLFPSGNKINAIRGSLPFGEVDIPDPKVQTCQQSQVGQGPVPYQKTRFFQPPAVHRGDVARALFYFSIRYKIAIDPAQEYFLRKWHKADPVSVWERKRQEQIYRIQGNRNPFIDYPEFVDHISDF